MNVADRRMGNFIMAGIVLGALFGWLFTRPYLAQTGLATLASAAGQSRIKLPAGFHAEVFASGLQGPRFMYFGPDDALYVAERAAGRIVALADRDGDGFADQRRIFAEDLNRPHSLVYHDGAW